MESVRARSIFRAGSIFRARSVSDGTGEPHPSLTLRALTGSISHLPLFLSEKVMADIALAFLWHQHQPYYPDDVAGENPMPWVRLHGVKDYWGMAQHLLEFPEMRCTINLVPSLLVQLLRYTENGGSDQFLDVSRIAADGLSESDALFLLD